MPPEAKAIMDTVAQLLREGREQLAAHSPGADLDARVLRSHVLGRSETWLRTWPEHCPGEEEAGRYRALLRRRARGCPVAYLTGEREFFGHPFRVSEAVLIPRPDTELLVETVLARLPGEGAARVADLGTGSGAVAVSLALARPQWTLLATDDSDDALELARANTRALGAGNVSLTRTHWCTDLPGDLDAVVSNPPYVAEGDPHLKEGDVRFEPRAALTAGPDGLDALRAIVEQAPAHLVPGGLLVLEHGYDQGEAVRALMHEAGLAAIETLRDLAGHERVTAGCR